MVYAVAVELARLGERQCLTSSNFVDFVLDKEVDQRHQRPKEATRKNLPPSDSLWILRAQGQAPKGPWERCDKVGDHEDVVPVMVVR